MICFAEAGSDPLAPPERRRKHDKETRDALGGTGHGGVPRDTAILVDFASDVSTSTVFTNVKLKKKGARRAVPVFASYTHATYVFEGFPQRVLQSDTVYQVIVDGGKLGGVDDPGARFRDGNVVWSFRTAE